MTTIPDRKITSDEAIALFGLRPTTVRDWLYHERLQPVGYLPARGRTGRTPLVLLSDVARLAAERAARHTDKERH